MFIVFWNLSDDKLRDNYFRNEKPNISDNERLSFVGLSDDETFEKFCLSNYEGLTLKERAYTVLPHLRNFFSCIRMGTFFLLLMLREWSKWCCSKIRKRAMKFGRKDCCANMDCYTPVLISSSDYHSLENISYVVLDAVENVLFIVFSMKCGKKKGC